MDDGCMTQTSLRLRPQPPFRLDLTVWALRRQPQNLIDRWDGTAYRRVIAINNNAFETSVSESRKHQGELRVIIEGDQADRTVKELIKQAVENTLGVHVDLHGFYRAAARDQKLVLLAHRFRGVKPPRFYSVFEGLINGIACQQLSLPVGIELLNRLARSIGRSIGVGASARYAFPRPQDLANLNAGQIRKLGFNSQKARAIVGISRAIMEGRLDLENLRGVSDEDAMSRLRALRGVGRWTAEYTLLRGMGRWHIFPLDDQGARNGLARWLRLRKPLDAAHAQHLLTRWEPYGGLIYFHMLMRGLDEAGYLKVRCRKPR
jgi:DNA-3-methyladenine glycosylase II